MSKVTQKHISDVTGVSQGDISKILSGKAPKRMPPEIVEFVLKTAVSLGYSTPSKKNTTTKVKLETKVKPKIKKVTQQQIADKAGVSQSIASKILRGVPVKGMSPKKIEAIHNAKKELGSNSTNDNAKTNQAVKPNAVNSEQKQLMSVLNKMEKDGKTRTKIAKKNDSLRTAWKGVAIGAGVIGIPLSIAGILNNLVDLIGKSADTARRANTLGIDPDKLIAMSRRAQVYGTSGESFTNALSHIQTLQTDLSHGINDRLMSVFNNLGVNAAGAKLQNAALTGSSVDFIKEMYSQYNQGKLDNSEVSGILSQLGAGALTDLFTNGTLGNVLNAAPIGGAAQSAIELDQALGKLKSKFEGMFIENFGTINKGLDRFSSWLNTTDFSGVQNAFSDLIGAISYIVGRIPNFESIKAKAISNRDNAISERVKELRKERSVIQSKYNSSDYDYRNNPKWDRDGKKLDLKNKINDLNQKMIGLGVDPSVINSNVKSNADMASLSNKSVQRIEHVHSYNLNITAKTGGDLTQNQFNEMEDSIKDVISRYMESDKIKIEERYT